MVKVFFDHQKFSTQKYGGISRYFANIIAEIRDTADFEYQLGVLISKNHYLNDQNLIPDHSILKYFLKSRLGHKAYKLNELYCNFLLSKNDFDLFHPTYYDTYFFSKLKKPFVITIHDMTYERLPEYFWAEDPLTYQKRLNIERADKIIAISETTKNDLLKYSNADPEKISVIYHGIDDLPLTFKPVDNLPENYLLFVGDRGGYKNFYLFLNAYKEFSARYPDLEVVLTGGGNLGISEHEFLKRLRIEHKVHHTNVTDEQLNYLYQNAVLFVYPSLHEGFGLPILEAFKAKCPVVLSSTECFREIAGNAAVYFSPHACDDLVTVLERLLTDSSARDELAIKGNERLKEFSITDSINQTLNLYRSLL